jgi:hypothetical protein
MEEIIQDPLIHKIFTSLGSGEINFFTGIIWLLFASIISMIGGAIGGIFLAKKDLGYELSAILGGFFGPAGVIPTIILGLIIINVMTSMAN